MPIYQLPASYGNFERVFLESLTNPKGKAAYRLSCFKQTFDVHYIS